MTASKDTTVRVWDLKGESGCVGVSQDVGGEGRLFRRCGISRVSRGVGERGCGLENQDI